MLVTFLLSGLWHGASWNYVLWGLYHGVLLVLTRAHEILRPSARGRAPRARRAGSLDASLQIPGMFVLTLVGWLLFRETELSAIVRDLKLSPFDSSPLERQAGLYLFLLAFVYSIPLWVQSIWVELHRGEPARPTPAAGTAPVLRAARLRRRVRGDPRPAQPHVARLHLLPVLTARSHLPTAYCTAAHRRAPSPSLRGPSR